VNDEAMQAEKARTCKPNTVGKTHLAKVAWRVPRSGSELSNPRMLPCTFERPPILPATLLSLRLCWLLRKVESEEVMCPEKELQRDGEGHFLISQMYERVLSELSLIQQM